MKNKVAGVITALATPFLKGKVDFVSFRQLVQDQLRQGIQGLVVNGTTGESPTLELDEVQELFQITQQCVKDYNPTQNIAVILGTGSNCTKKTKEATIRAYQWGADAALTVTPYYNKPTQRGLKAHFTEVAQSSPLPLFLYNVPSRTLTALSLETIVELSRHPQIVGLKEATGDLGFFAKIKAEVSEDFILLSGDDQTCVEFCRRGGDGVISVVSHIIPEELTGWIKRARQGDLAAEKEFLKMATLIRLLYIESNPIPLKAALYFMGLIRSPEMRLPLTTLEEGAMKEFQAELRKLGRVGTML